MACRKGSVTVGSYYRTAPRAKPKAPETYWTCEHGGRTCGTKHRTYLSSARHARRLELEARRRGRKANWRPTKVSR